MLLSRACAAGRHLDCEEDLEALDIGTDLCSCPCHDLDSAFDDDELGEDPEPDLDDYSPEDW